MLVLPPGKCGGRTRTIAAYGDMVLRCRCGASAIATSIDQRPCRALSGASLRVLAGSRALTLALRSSEDIRVWEFGNVRVRLRASLEARLGNRVVAGSSPVSPIELWLVAGGGGGEPRGAESGSGIRVSAKAGAECSVRSARRVRAGPPKKRHTRQGRGRSARTRDRRASSELLWGPRVRSGTPPCSHPRARRSPRANRSSGCQCR